MEYGMYEIYEISDNDNYKLVDEFEALETAEKYLEWYRSQSDKRYEVGFVRGV